MNRLDFIEHQGKRILVIDLSHVMPEELHEVVNEARELIDRHPEKSLLTLTRVEGARFNTEVVSTLKKFAKENDPFVRRGAIVGLQGLQKLVLEAVSKFTGRDFHVCESEEEAREKLVAG